MTDPQNSSAPSFTTARPPELDNGLCVGADPETFFPPNENAFEHIEEGKAICVRCPLIDLCLEHALKHEAAGTWGGASEWDRKSIKRNQQRAARAAARLA